jgi:hypothetical protein
MQPDRMLLAAVRYRPLKRRARTELLRKSAKVCDCMFRLYELCLQWISTTVPVLQTVFHCQYRCRPVGMYNTCPFKNLEVSAECPRNMLRYPLSIRNASDRSSGACGKGNDADSHVYERDMVIVLSVQKAAASSLKILCATVLILH